MNRGSNALCTICFGLSFTAFIAWLAGCGPGNVDSHYYKSEALEIVRLTDHTYVHTSYLQLPSGNFFPCNGLIYMVGGEAVVFDTPTTDSVGYELISWLTDEVKAKIIAVVVNHFHDDCLGGLRTFHNHGIPSYAHAYTPDLMTNQDAERPQNTFDDQLIINLGEERIINRYYGTAHSRDNIVSLIPADSVLFGGCMVKSVGAGKGNIADADTSQWPLTIGRIQEAYPDIRWVVPGHGKAGGVELLNYTRDLFKSN